MDPMIAQPLASALFSIYQHDRVVNQKSGVAQPSRGLDDARSMCNEVVDYKHRLPGHVLALDDFFASRPRRMQINQRDLCRQGEGSCKVQATEGNTGDQTERRDCRMEH